MENVILLKQSEAKEIGFFLAMFLADIHEGNVNKKNINTALLEHYKKFLLG